MAPFPSTDVGRETVQKKFENYAQGDESVGPGGAHSTDRSSFCSAIKQMAVCLA